MLKIALSFALSAMIFVPLFLGLALVFARPYLIDEWRFRLRQHRRMHVDRFTLIARITGSVMIVGSVTLLVVVFGR